MKVRRGRVEESTQNVSNVYSNPINDLKKTFTPVPQRGRIKYGILVKAPNKDWWLEFRMYNYREEGEATAWGVVDDRIPSSMVSQQMERICRFFTFND